MTELQRKMLDMLCEIDNICRKHDIEYCLFAGTGLGADRHRGFIPWDDDADILMTLENYEKFMQVFDAEAGENRVMNCLENDTDYPFTYGRYVDTSTTAIQRHTAFGGCDPGIKIDVFVAVPTHSDMDAAWHHRMEILAFSEVICPYAIMHHHRPHGYSEYFEKEQQLLEKLGREEYIRTRMSELKYAAAPDSGRYVLFSGMMCNSYFFDADTLDRTKYVPFEDTELMVSADNVTFSKELYGEGWISKPANVSVPRHTFLLDMERPYADYLDMLWQELDFEKEQSIISSRRNMHIYERDQYKDVIVNNQNLKNLAVELEVSARYRMLSAAERTDWLRLYELFGPYYSTQLRGINKHYQLFIPLEDEIFAAAMNSAIMADRYYEAADIMSIGFATGKLPLDDPMVRDIKERIDICRSVTETLYVEQNFVKLPEILGGAGTAGDSVTVLAASMWLTAINGTQQEAMDVCRQIDEYVGEYGIIGELLAIKGYCLEKYGDTDAAAEAYSAAVENIRNGYVYQWLTDKGFDTYGK